MEPTSEQDLKRLLEEGKITLEEYGQLLEAMLNQKQAPKQPLSPQEPPHGFSFRFVPWQIWVVVVLLGWEGIGNLSMILSYPWAAMWLLAKVVFIMGLLRGWKWIFFVFQVVAGIHVFYFAAAGAWLTAFLNLLLMVLIFSARRYFFGKKEHGGIGPLQTAHKGA